MNTFFAEKRMAVKKALAFGYSLFPIIFCFFCVSLFLFLSLSIVHEYSFKRAADSQGINYSHINYSN